MSLLFESSICLLLTQLFFNIGITHVDRKQRFAPFLLRLLHAQVQKTLPNCLSQELT